MRHAPTAAILAVVATLATGPPAWAGCLNQDTPPADLGLADYEQSILCVINERREEWGRPGLSPQRNLRRAATWHAVEMVEQGYFAHTAPDGDHLADRLDRANFVPSSDRWAAGENLAAGRGPSGTPAEIVAGWMQSSDHRLNLLDPDFDLAGVGLERGWPGAVASRDAITVTLDLGWRVLGPRR